MNKQTKVHGGGGIFSTKKKWPIKPWKDGTLNAYCCERSPSEKATVIPNVWDSRKDKAMETVKRSVVRVWREESIE